MIRIRDFFGGRVVRLPRSGPGRRRRRNVFGSRHCINGLPLSYAHMVRVKLILRPDLLHGLSPRSAYNGTFALNRSVKALRFAILVGLQRLGTRLCWLFSVLGALLLKALRVCGADRACVRDRILPHLIYCDVPCGDGVARTQGRQGYREDAATPGDTAPLRHR